MQTELELAQRVLDRLNRLDVIEERLASIEERLHAVRKDYYLVNELADLCGRSEYTVRRWITEGKIRALRVEGTGPRGKLLVGRAELAKLIRAGDVPPIPIQDT